MDNFQGSDLSLRPITSGVNPASITILSLSADKQDHSSLRIVFRNPKWDVLQATNLAAARALLRERSVSVLVCDCDSTQEPWTEIVEQVERMPLAPAVIVTSRLADDRLWSQALHLGAWDVLAKPFREAEVVRSVRYAWEHWRHQHKLRPVTKAVSAAG